MEEIKKAKEKESEDKTNVKSFANDLSQAVEAEAKRLTLKIEKWAESEIKLPLEKFQDLLDKINKKSMAGLVD